MYFLGQTLGSVSTVSPPPLNNPAVVEDLVQDEVPATLRILLAANDVTATYQMLRKGVSLVDWETIPHLIE